MSRSKLAILRWKAQSEGGRKALPTGATYSTAARFEGEGESWLNKTWSLVVEFVEPPNWNSHRVRICFLAEDAPMDLISSGRRFELMEGIQCVADGVVCD